MPSFEIQADIFTRLSVFDSPKGSSNTLKTHKNISLYFKRRYLIIYKYYGSGKCPGRLINRLEFFFWGGGYVKIEFGMYLAQPQPQPPVTIQQLSATIVTGCKNVPAILIQNAFDGTVNQ